MNRSVNGHASEVTRWCLRRQRQADGRADGRADGWWQRERASGRGDLSALCTRLYDYLSVCVRVRARVRRRWCFGLDHTGTVGRSHAVTRPYTLVCLRWFPEGATESGSSCSHREIRSHPRLPDAGQVGGFVSPRNARAALASEPSHSPPWAVSPEQQPSGLTPALSHTHTQTNDRLGQSRAGGISILGAERPRLVRRQCHSAPSCGFARLGGSANRRRVVFPSRRSLDARVCMYVATLAGQGKRGRVIPPRGRIHSPERALPPPPF